MAKNFLKNAKNALKNASPFVKKSTHRNFKADVKKAAIAAVNDYWITNPVSGKTLAEVLNVGLPKNIATWEESINSLSKVADINKERDRLMDLIYGQSAAFILNTKAKKPLTIETIGLNGEPKRVEINTPDGSYSNTSTQVNTPTGAYFGEQDGLISQEQIEKYRAKDTEQSPPPPPPPTDLAKAIAAKEQAERLRQIAKRELENLEKRKFNSELEKQRKINDLTDQLTTAQETKDKVLTDLLAEQAKIQVLTGELANANNIKDTAEGERDAARNQITTLATQLVDRPELTQTEYQRESEAAQMAYDQVLSEKISQQEANQRLNQKLNLLTSERDTARQERDARANIAPNDLYTLRAEKTAVENDLATRTNELRNMTAERDIRPNITQNQWDNAQANLTQSQTDLQQEQVAHRQTQRDLAAHINQRDTARQELATAETQRDDVIAELTTVKLRVTTLTNELAKNSRLLTNLTAKELTLLEEKGKLRTAMRLMVKQLNNLQNNLSLAKKEKQIISQNLSKKDQKIVNLRAKVATLKNEIVDLTTALANLEVAKNNLQNDLNQAQQTNNLLTQQLVDLQRQRAIQENNNLNLTAERNQLRVDLITRTTERDNARTTTSQKEVQINRLWQQLNHTQAAYNQLVIEKNQAETDRDEARRTNDLACQELVIARAANTNLTNQLEEIQNDLNLTTANLRQEQTDHQATQNDLMTSQTQLDTALAERTAAQTLITATQAHLGITDLNHLPPLPTGTTLSILIAAYTSPTSQPVQNSGNSAPATCQNYAQPQTKCDNAQQEHANYQSQLTLTNCDCPQKLNTELKLGFSQNPTLEQVINRIEELIKGGGGTINITQDDHLQVELKQAQATITQLEKELAAKPALNGEKLATIKQIDLAAIQQDLGIAIPPAIIQQFQQATSYQELVNVRHAFLQKHLAQSPNQQIQLPLVNNLTNQPVKPARTCLVVSLLVISGLLVKLARSRNKKLK